ncbi:MAG: ABC transporter permease [Acidimicrobiia bacterium]|nr:ABC transporter permease [Acidimicrobiia bacterium]
MRDEWIRWEWIGENWSDDIVPALREHVTLTLAAVLLGLLVSLPLGVLASRYRRLLGPVLTTTGVIYTIPALAAFGLLGPVTGYLTFSTAVIPLAAYTLLILVRNVVTGLDDVPEDAKEAAIGMGYGPWRRLFRVELPLALPAILAGVRIATVSTIALVTVAFLIGRGGLGQLILDGLRRDFRTPVVVGSVLSVALAILADLTLVGLQRLATPWARAR